MKLGIGKYTINIIRGSWQNLDMVFDKGLDMMLSHTAP